ncbi:MAG: hypothetical protein IT353_19175, partial [Gemmatimonadaceae bacterium]|nr:hypothetical protein [Gemmatimonadaceae bacterium]
MSDRLSLDPMRAAGTNYSQAPLGKDERLAAVTDYCTTKTAAGQPIHVADIAAHLRCSVAYAAKELRRAVAAGTVVKLAGRDGWIATAPLAPATRRVTLRDLLELARRRASTAASPHRGRRALHVSHDIHEITPGQL